MEQDTPKMEHVVSIQDRAHDSRSWISLAAFLYHVDAVHFAQRLSNQDHLERTVRVEGGRNYVNAYYRRGEEGADGRGPWWELS